MPDTNWPYNVVDEVATVAGASPYTDGDPAVELVVKRPAQEHDPSHTIAIHAKDWVPVEHEMGMEAPVISRYVYTLQVWVKHHDEAEGQRTHAILSKMMRTMLYLNADLEVAFAELTETQDGHAERFLRRGVDTQRFFASEMQRTFMFLSTIDFWVDAQTVRTS